MAGKDRREDILHHTGSCILQFRDIAGQPAPIADATGKAGSMALPRRNHRLQIERLAELVGATVLAADVEHEQLDEPVDHSGGNA
jgi:hypothetical protein